MLMMRGNKGIVVVPATKCRNCRRLSLSKLRLSSNKLLTYVKPYNYTTIHIIVHKPTACFLANYTICWAGHNDPTCVVFNSVLNSWIYVYAVLISSTAPHVWARGTQFKPIRELMLMMIGSNGIVLCLLQSVGTVAGSLCPSNWHNPSKKDVTAMEVESCCNLVRHDVLHDSPSCFMQVPATSISKNADLPIETGSLKCKWTPVHAQVKRFLYIFGELPLLKN